MYSVGKLQIDPATGEVNYETGGSIRLGPVNMKVLAALIEQSGEVVTRHALFEQVWKNQVVSDDALTRCISDIRAQLEALTGESKYIETVPKRGYRWIYSFADGEPVIEGCSVSTAQSAATTAKAGSFLLQRTWLRWSAIVLVYAVALFVLASAVVWGFGYFARPGPIRLAVFATETSRGEFADQAMAINNQLTAALVAVDEVEVLSQSAVALGRDNPFPYFFYEFGVQWVVESRLSGNGQQPRLTISVVDARSATVVFLSMTEFDAAAADWQQAVEQFVAQLRMQLPQPQ